MDEITLTAQEKVFVRLLREHSKPNVIYVAPSAALPEESAIHRLVHFMDTWITETTPGFSPSPVHFSGLTGEGESTETLYDLCKKAEIELRNGLYPSLMHSHHQTLIDKAFKVAGGSYTKTGKDNEIIVRKDTWDDLWAYLHGAPPYTRETECPRIEPVPVVVVIKNGQCQGVYSDYGSSMRVTVVDMDGPDATRENVESMTAAKTAMGQYSADLSEDVFE